MRGVVAVEAGAGAATVGAGAGEVTVGAAGPAIMPMPEVGAGGIRIVADGDLVGLFVEAEVRPSQLGGLILLLRGLRRH